MKRQIADQVRFYVRKLSDTDLVWLHHRLTERMGDDLSRALIFMSRTPEMDRWLASSRSADELYDMIDIIVQYISQDSRLPTEYRRSA